MVTAYLHTRWSSDRVGGPTPVQWKTVRARLGARRYDWQYQTELKLQVQTNDNSTASVVIISCVHIVNCQFSLSDWSNTGECRLPADSNRRQLSSTDILWPSDVHSFRILTLLHRKSTYTCGSISHPLHDSSDIQLRTETKKQATCI